MLKEREFGTILAKERGFRTISPIIEDCIVALRKMWKTVENSGRILYSNKCGNVSGLAHNSGVGLVRDKWHGATNGKSRMEEAVKIAAREQAAPQGVPYGRASDSG
jgi:hypothetical protein